MKSFKKIFIVLVFCILALTLVSCAGTPELDFEVAKENLERDDYNVTITDDIEKLEKNVVKEIHAVNSTGEYILHITEYKDIISAIIAYETLRIQYNNEMRILNIGLAEAKYFQSAYKSEMNTSEYEEYTKIIREYEEEIEDLKETVAYGISGTKVWYGTSSAVESSKEN